MTSFVQWWAQWSDSIATPALEHVARAAWDTALAGRRPFSDKLAQEVIDGQVKEIDRLTKLIQAERAMRPEAIAIVQKHRRHVELSPGAGADVQSYAIAVCDDILADLSRPQLPSEGKA